MKYQFTLSRLKSSTNKFILLLIYCNVCCCSIIPTAFFATMLIFVCFTLSALWAEQRTYLYLGGETVN